MQQPIAACTRAQTLSRTCPCATCIWLLHPAPTSAQDGLDPLQLVLVEFSLSSNSTDTSLALVVVITCNLHWWCFFYANYSWSIYILMCTNPLVCFATCTVWWWCIHIYNITSVQNGGLMDSLILLYNYTYIM